MARSMVFDASVRRELARTFGATLVVILTIVVTMMSIRVLGLAAGGAVAPDDVALLLGYFALGHLPTMLALSMFVAVVVAFGRMHRASEMVVWHASGVPLAAFVRPLLRAAWPVLAAVAALLLLVWPWGNRASAELRARYEQRSDLARVTPGVFQSSRDGSRVFFIDRDAAAAAGAAPAEGRNVFVLTRGPRGEAVTSAHRGRIVDDDGAKVLELDEGQRNETAADGTRLLSSFAAYRVRVGERAPQAAAVAPPKATSTWALLRAPTPAGRGELAWRFGMLLAAGNLLLLGLGLSVASPRRGGGWGLVFSLLAFVVYFNLINLSQAWVAAGRLGLGTALLGLHGGAFALGWGLLRWRDGGLPRRRGRMAAAGA